MPKTTSGLEILYGLGYDPVDIESDADYIRALKESFNRLQIQNPSDPRLEPLANAVKGYKYAKSKKEAGKSGGKSRAAKRRKGESYDVVKARIDAKEAAKKFISPKSSLNISKLSPTKGGGGDFLVIKEKVVSIEALLGEQYRLQEENAKDAKQEAEKKRRSLKERLLEGSGKIWDGVKKATSTVLKPFQSIWSKIIDFIQTIILGRILFKILEWAGNKQNQGKIKSIFKFLEDWWPTLLTAYVLFGTSFTKMAVGLVKAVAWGVVKLLKLIPLLKAALAKLKLGKLLSMIPGGKGKAGLLMKGGMLIGGGLLFNKAMSGDSESDTFTEDDIGSTVTPRDFDSYYSKEDKEKINQMMEEKNFNKGGPVPGSGNKDTVPAMLTPGEFVMSKGAVQQYGVDTLAGMNAAAGGTNKPSFMDGKLGYSSGGLVQPIVKAGSINSYEDAIKAGVKVEDTVVGNMRYGSINWTEKLPKGLFGFGKQRYQIMGTKWIVDGIGEDHNKTLAMPTEDYVNKRMGWDKESSSSAKDLSTKSKGQGNQIKAVPSKSGDPNIGQLSKKKPKVVVVDNPNEEVDASQAQLPSQGNREIPSFDATSIRSPRKMEVLGISI